MVLLPAVGETLTIAATSIPAIWELHSSAGKNILSVSLSLCLVFAGIVRVLAAQNSQTFCDTTTAIEGGKDYSVRGIKNRGVQSGNCKSTPSTEASRDDDDVSLLACNGGNAEDGVERSDADLSVATATPVPPSTKDSTNKQEGLKLPKIEKESSSVGNGKRRSYRRGGEVLYIAEGVAEAVVGIVRDPVRGARDEGAKGLVKGIGSGLVGMVARPMIGIVRAGYNTLTGLRIGVARARHGGRGGSLVRKPSKEANLSALPDQDRLASPGRIVNGVKDGFSRARPGTANDAKETACEKQLGSVMPGESTARTRYLSGSYEGLVVGIATVPLVLSSLFLLANEKQLGLASGERDSVEGIPNEAFSIMGMKALPSLNLDTGAPSRSDAGAGEYAVALAYLEAILDGSVLCAVSEVVFVVQRFFDAQGWRSKVSRVFTSGPFRLTLLTLGYTNCCRRPLMALWCLAVYDLFRRLLEAKNGKAMHELSLRSGEATALAQAIALWTVDGIAYTFQELWAPEASEWERMFPRVPAKSGVMVIIQTGLLGTLATGSALAAARTFLPRPWSSGLRSHLMAYLVLVGGTIVWLAQWTAPLLGSNPVSWGLCYALGFTPMRRTSPYQVGDDGGTGSGVVSWLRWWKSRGRSLVSSELGWLSKLGTDETQEKLGTPRGVDADQGVSVYRPMLVVGWLVALLVVVPAVPWAVKRLSLSKVAARKVFHALATAMFVPAIALEPSFLSLALGAALGLLLFVDFFRCTGCPPLASVLDSYFGDFLDARDRGSLVVTHLSLLLGCAIPLWLSGLMDNGGSLAYAGVVVVGIGDAMGAVVGLNFGRCHWPGSRRTVEGSAAVFVSSLAGLLVIACFLHGNEPGMGQIGWGKKAADFVWPVMLATLMEAFTSQVDNLVLPCVLFSSLALSSL